MDFGVSSPFFIKLFDWRKDWLSFLFATDDMHDESNQEHAQQGCNDDPSNGSSRKLVFGSHGAVEQPGLLIIIGPFGTEIDVAVRSRVGQKLRDRLFETGKFFLDKGILVNPVDDRLASGDIIGGKFVGVQY